MTEAFWAAATTGDQESLSNLLKNQPSLADETGPGGISVLMLALYHGREEVAKIISNYKSTWNIFEASAIGNVDQVQIQANAFPDVVNSISHDGFSPLGFACYFGRQNVVDLLLSCGADPNSVSKNDFQVAPLHSAMAGGHVGIANLLLDYGADVNIAAGGGWTPLHYAVDLGDAELAKRILDAGADTAAINDEGFTAIELGEECGHTHVSDLIRAHDQRES